MIFIDELDAIGSKRFDSELSGDREVQRTMLELLNQLDGFSSDERIKVRYGFKLAFYLLVVPARMAPFKFALFPYCRSLLRRIVSIFWIQHCYVPVVSIGRSNFLHLTRAHAHGFCRFIPGR